MIVSWRKVGLMEREWRRKLLEERFNHFVIGSSIGYLSLDFKFFSPTLICGLLQKNCFIVVCLTFHIYETEIMAISSLSAGEGILKS